MKKKAGMKLPTIKKVFDMVHELLHEIDPRNHEAPMMEKNVIRLDCITDRPWVKKRGSGEIRLSPVLEFYAGTCQLCRSEERDDDPYPLLDIPGEVEFDDPMFFNKC